MLRRNRALQKTADKYRGKAFKWGTNDCVKMARSHLVAMGHKPPKMPSYRSAVGAKAALKKAGHRTLESLFDALLPRIAPAAMLPGDIAMMKGPPPFDAVVICLGRKVMGYGAEDLSTGVMNIIPYEFIGAWRA